MIRAVRSTLVASLVGVLAVAGCSGGGTSGGQQSTGGTTAAAVNGTQQVTVTVGDDFRFHPSTITVHPGTVQITLVHKGSGAPHDWELTKTPSDHSPLVNAGQTVSYTFTTPSPGRYKFECTLHVAQGMTGTLVVLPS